MNLSTGSEVDTGKGTVYRELERRNVYLSEVHVHNVGTVDSRDWPSIDDGEV